MQLKSELVEHTQTWKKCLTTQPNQLEFDHRGAWPIASTGQPGSLDSSKVPGRQAARHTDFEKIGNLIEITKYIRSKTYSLDPKPVNNT